MCHHHFAGESEIDKKVKFYKHLRVYLTVIGVSLVARFLGTGHLGFPSFAFWWGVGLIIHYLSVFGWEGFTDNQYSNSRDLDIEDKDYMEPEPLVDERVPRRNWRDRDLV